MNHLRLGIALIALAGATAALADDTDSRTAKVTDRSDVESQVSALTVSNADVRFGYANLDSNGRIVVTTRNVAYAIPVREISSVLQTGAVDWTVKFVTKDGEQSVEGALPDVALLLGSSDFGSFSLPLLRLKRLEFTQPGIEVKPARRLSVYDRAGHLRPQSFTATLNLTDGTSLQVSDVRRNEAYAQSTTDPALLNVTPEYTLVCTNFTDLNLLRGETTQTVPFENIKIAEYLPGDAVLVKTKGGAEAEMKLPLRDEQSVEGFTGSSGKGDFYVPIRFVKSIDFDGEPPK